MPVAAEEREGATAGQVDGTETAPEVEVKAGEEAPIDPTNPFNEMSGETFAE